MTVKNDLTAKMYMKDGIIEGLKTRMNAKDDIIEGLKMRMDAKDSIIECLKVRMDEKNGEIEHMDEKIEGFEEQRQTFCIKLQDEKMGWLDNMNALREVHYSTLIFYSWCSNLTLAQRLPNF
jgi:hypothetical protein